MTTFICSISNESPEVPVISPKSGLVYDKRLIEKVLESNGGVDPVSKDPLSVEELIAIKASPLVKPKPPSGTSIPAILKSLQDEWDAVMLHSFTLRQQLQTARQELSHALYQHDAACRVIARLTKEVTAAREALATLKPQAAIPSAPATPATPSAPEPSIVSEALEPVGMNKDIIDKLQDKATILTQERKKRGKMVPEDLVSGEDIRGSFRTLASHPGLHSASAPGILSLDVNANDTSKILTGGADRSATVFNKDTEQIVANLKGHSKKISRVIYHPSSDDTVITASHDTTVRVWHVPSSQTLKILRIHDGPVTGLSLHATGDYILSTSTDRYWAFTDLRSGRLITKVTADSSAGGASSSVALTCAQFHPDGLIFGTGTSDSEIKIWDLKEQQNVANFPGHNGSITALSFSENGYYLATAADDACVKLWDLRKLKNFKTIALEDGYEVRDLCFDQSGTYLAVAGTDVRIYQCKQWQELRVFNDHTAMATGVRFGKHANYVASTSMDRTLKLYGL
ncbi:pre-mRNA-processing factor 19 [Lepeophtheirus salmonis]|uniref:pre-mRNA-processing factor 19 n=1 Tax=Lepeophtheirus salmonis TaxID=72036 RepID=UPI001AE6792A|nr:pre-mRNA-processing factor 19-like [Lepeophtheirus salmonis]